MTIQELCALPPGSITDAELEQHLRPYWPITRRQIDSRLLAKAKHLISEARVAPKDDTNQWLANTMAKLQALGVDTTKKPT